MNKKIKFIILLMSMVLSLTFIVGCKHEHLWTEAERLEATCTDDGFITYTCEGCEEIQTEVITALGHIEEIIQAVSPTCSSSGNTEGTKCSRCDEVLNAPTYIPYLEHKYEDYVCKDCGYEFYTYGLEFSKTNYASEEAYVVSGYNGTNSEVIIPSKYMNKPVIGILEEAFLENFTIQTIRLPESITFIGKKAFYECEKLKEITIPSQITEILSQTFYGCESLETVEILGNLEVIYEEAFYRCDELVQVDFAGDVIEFKNKSFYGCSSLNKFTFPSSCRIIGEEAFVLTNLGNVVLPEGLVTLGARAFDSSGINGITIPSTIQEIAGHTFYNCDSLTSVTISEGVTKIGAYAFASCGALKQINIPASVTCVEAYVFAYCELLEKITVDVNNTVYDSRENCNAIIETATNTLIAGCWKTSVKDSVTKIGEAAFFGCGLSSIYLHNNITEIGESAFSQCKDLSSVTIPEKVIIIEAGTFAGCQNLTEIIIKGNVTEIRDGAFKATIRLTKVVIPASLEKFGENVFYNASTNAVIYYRGLTQQWAAIVNSDQASVNNYVINGKIVYNYQG